MSSVFPPESKKNEALVIGSSWPAGLIGRAFARQGKPCREIHLPFAPGHRELPSVPVYLGNGECRENARLIYGEKMSSELWEISRRNYEQAKSVLSAYRLPVSERGTLWPAHDQRETELLEASGKGEARASFHAGTLHEPGLVFSPAALSTALEAERVGACMPPLKVEKLLRLDRVSSLETRVVLQQGGKELSLSAAVIVLLLDALGETSLVPWVSDKWIPVTLSSFTFPVKVHPQGSLSLHHLGVDFAVDEGQAVRLGSFRNLFQDKAVGIHQTPDPMTLKGVSSFFGRLGFIDEARSPTPHLCLESLSCDGLPIAGALPESPGIYVLGGFSGRGPNFLFEVAERLAFSIVNGGDFAPLRLFSTKRFL